MRRRGIEGLTLVEAAVVVSLVGLVLAVFVPTFFRHLRTSKIDEASRLLTQLATAADSYYSVRHNHRRRCLPAGAGPLPAAPSPDPVEVDPAAAPGATTWAALGFAPERPLRYTYEFVPTQEGCDVRVRPGEPLYTLRAVGDLDGDGRRSTFELSTTLDEAGAPVALDVLYVRDRVE